ncbi:MAG: hypothetical protein R3330_00815, partial [Saprospiraceae bacterium]|nr:hypothetical protein [Saprospiraceae bacterium]
MGGMQDNGSWSGPAYKWEMMGSIKNSDFRSVGFGDGFDVIADPEDNRYGYSLWQGGRFMRYDKELGLIKMIAPVEQGDTKLRWNWNAAIAQDPFDVNTVYVGSQFVHKSTDKGLSWKIISPDLTTNDSTKQQQKTTGGLTLDNTTAENHCSILVIEPSTIERGTMWVGTDDGNVQVSRDGGLTWTNVTNNIRESDRIAGRTSTVPPNTWVPQIKASTYNPGSAFVVFDDHRRNNWEPYVYKTDNYGRTWRRIVDGDDMRGYALCIAQDREEPNLIFVGTEFGLFVTFDGGKNWEQFKHGLPTCSVMDMVIHPREGDLVVGTFGRSAWVLDDIRPLRELALDTAIVHDTIHMFEPSLAYQAVQGMPAFFSGSSDQFSGSNRPTGAILNYWSAVKSEKDSVKITVYGNDGKVFRELKHTAKPGLNRLTWDLKKEQARMPGPPNPFSGFFSNGVEALPGDYMVTVANGDHVDTTEVEVKMDPTMPISMHAFRINLERKGRYQDAVKAAGEAYDRLTETSKQIKKLQDFIADRKDSSAVAVKAAADTLQMGLKKLMEECVPTPGKGIAGDTDDLVAQLGRVGMYFFSSMTVPGTQEEAELKKVEENVRAYSGKVEKVLSDEYVEFGELLESSGLMMLSVPKSASKS